MPSIRKKKTLDICWRREKKTRLWGIGGYKSQIPLIRLDHVPYATKLNSPLLHHCPKYPHLIWFPPIFTFTSHLSLSLSLSDLQKSNANTNPNLKTLEKPIPRNQKE